MNETKTSLIISVGLAIFSMLFGAGNLLYPIMVGVSSGEYDLYGMLGFSITAIILPLAGLLGMILFEGNYKHYYQRLGVGIGNILIFCSMLVIGPVIAIPRIVTLSHTMIAPFLPASLQVINLSSSFLFALLFLGITFALTHKKTKIVDMLGNVISPALLVSMIIIMVVGFYKADQMISASATPIQLFKLNFIRGYETLDLLGAIFFASIILSILTANIGSSEKNKRTLAIICLKAGAIGATLLAIVYTGMSLLGAYYGFLFNPATPDTIFRDIAFHILGSYGAAIIGTAVLMACLSTSIALSAVIADYARDTLWGGQISYPAALAGVLIASIPLSTFGLKYVLSLTAGPIVYIGYPVIIMLTFCNIAYKLFNMTWVKLPVLLTVIIATISYLF